MNVQNTIQKSTILIVVSQTDTKLNVENLIRIRMNEIETQIKGNLIRIRMNETETQIKGNLSGSEVGAIRQAEKSKLLEGQSMATL